MQSILTWNCFLDEEEEVEAFFAAAGVVAEALGLNESGVERAASTDARGRRGTRGGLTMISRMEQGRY